MHTYQRSLVDNAGFLHLVVQIVALTGTLAYTGASVGRCNHESGCGYHYTPKQYYQDNPQLSEFSNTIKEGEVTARVKQNHPKFTQRVEEKEPGRIPKQHIIQSLGYNSNFVAFLCSIFDRYTLESPTIRRVMADYYLGYTKNGSVIYWQIDTKGKVRTGKVMKYDPNSGHRIKNGGGINWIHSMMKKRQLLPEDYNLVQCLFGEHLLRIYPDRIVVLVESEKSALIASGVYPNYIWLATGGKSQLSIDKLKVLKGRRVIMFPDVDGFEYWSNKAKELECIGCRVIVSDLLERNATDEERDNKIDLADWIIVQLSTGREEMQNELTKAEQNLLIMKRKNSALQELVDVFGLELYYHEIEWQADCIQRRKPA